MSIIIDDILFPDVYDPTTKKVKMSNIHPSLVLALRPSEIQLAKHFRQQLVKIGELSVQNV